MEAMLDEDWRDVARQWMESFLEPELLDNWGEIDTSDNVYGDMSTALSQPGHYSRGWSVRHTDRRANRVTGPDGIMARCGYASRMTFCERYAWGLADYVLHIQAESADKVTFHPVSPSRIYAEGSDADPSSPVVLWHLRWRYLKSVADFVWCWDQYNIRDPESPSFKIVAGENFESADGTKTVTEGEDLTAAVLGEAYTGKDGYPWVSVDGSAVIPYAICRTVDSGRMWTHMARYGAFKATLVLAQVATYVLHAARDASGSMVLTYGLEMPASRPSNSGERGSSNRLIFTPGAVAFLSQKTGADKVGVETIGPGANLQPLTQFMHMYRQLAAQRYGVSAGNAVRNDANPTSASALLITQQQKMDAVRSADPLFRRFDAEVMRIVSVVLRPHGVTVPETGYTFEYWSPPPTPAEMAEQREQEQYDEQNGYASKVSNYQARHPGMTRADAIQELARFRLDELELAASVAAGSGASSVAIDPDDYDDIAEELDGIVDVINTAITEGRQLTAEELARISESASDALSVLAGEAGDEVDDSSDGSSSGDDDAS